MSRSSENIMGFGSSQLIVAPGATNALLVFPAAGQNYTRLKYGSGGSLEIIGVPDGVTLTAAQLVSASGNHYLVGTTEVIDIPKSAPRFYLSALSATTIVFYLEGRSSGV